MVSKIREGFCNLSIRAKYVLTLYTVLLILFLLLAATLLCIARRNAEQDALNSAAKSASYSNLIIEKEQQYLYGIASYYAITEEVQQLIGDSNEHNTRGSLPQAVLDLSQRQSYVLSLAFYNGRGQVIDYFSIDGSYGAVNQNVDDPSRPISQLMEGKSSYLWEYIPKGDTVYMTHDRSPKLCLWYVVRDNGPQKPIGAIAITVDSRKLLPDQYQTLDLNDNLLILDTQKRQVFGRTELAQNMTMKEINHLIGSIKPYRNTGGFPVHINGRAYFAAYSRLRSTTLVSFALIEDRLLPDNINAFFTAALAGVCLLCVSILPILLLVTRFLTGPLRQLAESMEQFSEGDLTTQVHFRGHDEIGQLGKIFNEMVQENKRLIEESYLLTIRTQEAELAKLQAQINPHFIYNTINAIQWTAIDRDEPEIAEMAYSVGQVFRLSLSGGQEFVTVAAEQELLYFYLSLQEKRFEDRLSYTLNFAPELLSVKIPKLLIQPLVENASVHGAADARSRVHITVNVTRSETGRIHIEVSDDGVGIPPKILALLPDRLPKNPEGPSSHFALRNISKRLQLYYGSDYVFHIDSTPHIGTDIVIDLPASLPAAEKI